MKAMGSKGEPKKNFWLQRHPSCTRRDAPSGVRRTLREAVYGAGAGADKALIRLARRDNFRATVFLCNTPLVVARCNSGCASWSADRAVSWSPSAIAISTFLTKVRTLLLRARLIAVRFAVWRIRFSADLWVAMLACPKFATIFYRSLPVASTAAPQRTNLQAARGVPHHRFLKAGGRFSMKAVMPSLRSSVAKVAWNTRRSKRTPSASVVS
jgi:hypothetical protein